MIRGNRRAAPRGPAPAARCLVYVARIADLRPGQAGLLDEHEAWRLARLQPGQDRDRFLLAAALLRAAAGLQAGIAPAAVAVDRSCDECGKPHGRPRLPGSGLAAAISHSGDLAAVALTAAGPVGVDVEAISAGPDHALLDLVCTAAERAFVSTGSDFFSYWTRKEAVLKATGQGLRLPMTELTVAPPGRPAALVTFGGGQPPPCQLADLTVGAGYAAAAAVLTDLPVTFSTLDGGPMLRRL